MKIQKLGHCCLVIEVDGVKIVTDPGTFTTEQNMIKDIDIVVITHEHGDHFHIESVKEILKNNPKVSVVTNSGVGKKLDEAKIAYTLLQGKDGGGDATTIKNILIEAFDGRHEEIFEEIGQVQNTGYLIADQFFYPGDSYIKPGKSVHVLALPVSGPWCKIPDAIRYALAVKPKFAFPVHDGMLKDQTGGFAKMVGEMVLSKHHIQFAAIPKGEVKEF